MTHVLRTLAPLPPRNIATPGRSSDLHVLSTPPAFVLSQNQTLRNDVNDSFDLERSRTSKLIRSFLRIRQDAFYRTNQFSKSASGRDDKTSCPSVFAEDHQFFDSQPRRASFELPSPTTRTVLPQPRRSRNSFFWEGAPMKLNRCASCCFTDRYDIAAAQKKVWVAAELSGCVHTRNPHRSPRPTQRIPAGVQVPRSCSRTG